MNDCLIFASYSGNKDLINFLINSYPIDINTFDKNGKTALMIATMASDLDTIRILLKNGADINIKDKSGRNALILSVQSGKLEIAEFLIIKGADVNNKDNNGELALMFAAMDGNIGLAELLISNGADINARSINNASPMYFAVFNDDMANCLYNYGAEIYSIEGIEEGFYKYASAYQWAAQYYENKYFYDDKNNKLDKINMVNNFIQAEEHYKRASSECAVIADRFKTERIVKVLVASTATALVHVGAQMQAQHQAKQAAEIDALMSSSGKGRGVALIEYHTFSPDTHDIKALEKHYREESETFSTLSITINRILNCYNSKGTKLELIKCVQVFEEETPIDEKP